MSPNELDKYCHSLLVHLVTVQAIAKHGREDWAATELGIASNSVSARLQKLHAALDNELVFQTGTRHNLPPTKLGERYLKMADAIIPHLQEFLTEFRRQQDSHQREVHIATISSPWFTYKDQFKKHCQNIQLVPDFCDHPDHVRAKVAEGACDVGIVSYIDRVAPPLRLHVWVREPMVLAVSARHPKFASLGPRGMTREHILSATFLACNAQYRLAQEVNRYLQRVLGVKSSVQMGDIETVVKGVAANDGISILPAPYLKNNAAIKTYPLPEPMMPRPLAVLCHRHALKYPAICQFLGYFGDALANFKKAGDRRPSAARRR
jgi:DNA-binding transcriptional LysR family regulator